MLEDKNKPERNKMTNVKKLGKFVQTECCLIIFDK